MSFLDKLSIQGIRSFNPDDKQVIVFFSPLTLILGPNGTGKTTIIECLKYMTTGELPPGGKNGAAFINDPKLSRSTEVKAQIRLQFFDVKGEECIAQRSITATQKKTKIEMRTLEGLITRKLANGEKRSVSSKCLEMDREMVSMLGVSKAVLENVIFCHQEESNWPLSEGKVLKNKFDEIFASTKYVKALDIIRKFRQEQMVTIREYQAEMKYLKNNKETAAEKQLTLSDRESRHRAAIESGRKVDEKLNPILIKLKMIEEKDEDIHRIKNIIEKLEGERSQLQKMANELLKNIHNKFSGSMDDLVKETKKFHESLLTVEQHLNKDQDKLQMYTDEDEQLQRRNIQIHSDFACVQQSLQKLQLIVKERNAMYSDLALEFKIVGFEMDNISDNDVKRFVFRIQDEVKKINQEIQLFKESCQKEILTLQNDIDSQRGLKMKLETEKHLKEEIMSKNRDELTKINNELSSVDASSSRLNNIKLDVQKIEFELNDIERSVDIDQLKSEIQLITQEKAELEIKLKSLDGELSQLTQESNIRTQFDMLSKDKAIKEEQKNRLLAKNEDSLKYLFNEIPSISIKNSLQKYINDKSKHLSTYRDKLQKLHTQRTKYETSKKMHYDNLLRKQNDLKELEIKITTVTKGNNLEEGLQKIQTHLNNNQDNKGHLMAVDYMFKKYIEKLKRENPDCPLCHRCFDEQPEIDELIVEMETKLGMIPEKMERIMQAIQDAEKDYDSWLQLKPIMDQVNKIKHEISNIEKLIEIDDNSGQKITKEINELEELVESLSSDKSLGESLICDASAIDQLIYDYSELTARISNIQSKLLNKTGKSFHDVQNEKREIQLQLEMSNQRVEHKRIKLNDHCDCIQQLKCNINELKCEQLKIESKLQDRCRLEGSKTQINQNNTTLVVEIKNIKEDLLPINNEIEKLNISKEKLIKKNNELIESMNSQLNKTKMACVQIENLHKDVEKYKNENCEEKFQQLEDTLRKMESRLNELNIQKSQLVFKIESSKKLLVEQKMRFRELEDNMRLLRYQEDLLVINRKIESEKVKFGDIDVDNLLQVKTQLQDDAAKFKRERDACSSRQQILEGEMSTLNKDLTSDQFKDAEEKYRNKMIMLRTTEIANSDLEKYYKALDRIIMSYHCQKMTDINKIIKHLWKTTYKGHDIDTIEIRSSEEEGSGAAKSRRSYNYRVVMLKSGVELDMRGRCSAGQKVLASIIIRLALAETFCLNCGVLALDEPTTNLDRENIESLATALVEIITLRSEQRNFQLIVITHDEDFVELLGRSQYVEDFFRVSKCDQTGFSKLTQSSIQDLQSK